MESSEHSFIVDDYVKWFNYFGKPSGSLLRIQLLNDAAILLVAIYPRKMKNMYTKTQLNVHTTFFIVNKNWRTM